MLDATRLDTLVEKIQSYTHIVGQVKTRLLNLVKSYSHCFGISYEHLRVTDLVKFCVDTGNAKPIYNLPYDFIPHSERKIRRLELEEMVETGIVERTTHTPDNAAIFG